MASTLDPKTPVIVGVAQRTDHPTSPEGRPEPAAVLADVLRAAAADAGAPSLLGAATSLRTIDQLGWRSTDAPGRVAGFLGIDPAERFQSAVGGNSPQSLVNDACTQILAGRHDVVLIGGVELMYTRTLAGRVGHHLDWHKGGADEVPATVVGDQRSGIHDAEAAAGLFLPVHVYPILETALRVSLGRTRAEHTAVVAGLWSRFSAVAAANPNAWSRTALTPEQIASPEDGNRMIASPYRKLMTANIQVDQAAALVVCSVEAARSAGVAEDRWVFPLAGADAHDHWYVGHRHDLGISPAIAALGRAVTATAGVAPAEARWIDLYSCFPVAVEMAATALGLPLDDPDRPLTLTGGLTFGGGPGNDYTTHGIAQVVEACRRDPSAVGLATGLGWYATKHSLGLYSASPPARPFRAEHPQAEVDGLPSRSIATGPIAAATLEAWTVTYDRDGAPEKAIAACLTADGARTWATTDDDDAMAALEQETLEGTPVVIRDGVLVL